MRDRPADEESERARVRDRLRELDDERKRLDERRERITEERHRLLRVAHDLGWTWTEIANFAGYANAAVARNQAVAREPGSSTSHPPGTYSVREAAERLGVSAQTIYSYIDSGKLEAVEYRTRGKRVYLPDAPSSVDRSK